MKENTTRLFSGQGSEQQSAVLSDMCYRFVAPLLNRLYAKLDRRLVQHC
jgi:hypothetical protein